MCLVNPGTLAVCIREVQKSLLQSSKRLMRLRFQAMAPSAPIGDRLVNWRLSAAADA